MDSVPDFDLLESFGLENDKEMDFETAYRMISNFDGDISRLHEDSVFPKLEYTQSDSLDGIKFSHAVETSHSRHEEGHMEPEKASKWEEHQRARDKDDMTGQLNEGQSLEQAELLSTYESNAIEHFLDSLVFQDNRITSATIAERPNDTISMADLKVTFKKEEAIMEEKKTVTSTDYSSLEVYIPPAIDIPQLSIKDMDIPKDVLEDAAKLRKWKHVENERLRRNSTKKIFDELIDMTRYPRIADPKITKPRSDKRVPKHTLLNFILEDLKLILNANEELENMIRNSQANGNKTAENGISIF